VSTVRANNYYDASGGSNAQLYGVASPPNSMGNRNRIINGDMRIDQRNAGASVTIGGSTVTYTVDRWYAYATQASKFSVQRSTTAPTGFTNSALITSLSAYSVVSGDVFGFVQPIEGFNFADLGWGTASAQTVTLSFVVRSSLTGTFGGSIRNGSSNRSYPFTYTINAANTFETKTVTIAGDTTGTWATDNSAAAYVTFGLGVGSTYSGTAGAWAGSQLWSATGATSVVGTNGATFYITGVQLEAGTVASPFERRDYGRELMMCQRYYWNTITGNGVAFGAQSATTAAEYWFTHPVYMRTGPTLSYTAVGNFSAYSWAGGAGRTLTSATIANANSRKSVVQVAWSSAVGSAGQVVSLDSSSSDFWAFSAEL
jgi:hypothetical protein